MTRIRMLVRHAAELPSAADAWLTAAERVAVAGFRMDKRRNEWRLGRWTAKHLIAVELGLERDDPALARIEVRAAQDGAPEPLLDGEPLDFALSISHSAGVAVCVTAPQPVALGCDVELIRALRRGTVARHFTPREQALLDGLEPHDWAVHGTLIWTAKESALKALRQGLRLDTRTVEAAPTFDGEPGAWRPVAVTHAPAGTVFRGWWKRIGDHVLSIVADPAAARPVP